MAVKQRLWVISDIHIDYKENREALLALSNHDYQNDALIIAGDATDKLELLETFLDAMVGKFAKVLFVPGNHELWLKQSEFSSSVEKFDAILALCEKLGVVTTAIRFGEQQPVWLVPLFSWYHTNEHPDQSLYWKKQSAEDKTFDMWSDFFVTQWPAAVKDDICGYFLQKNEPLLARTYDAPVVSFSHFLPRQELMLSTEQERAGSDLVFKDLHPEFNFSHVAGSKGIDEQVRRLGSKMHVYGHQHRNRYREIDGVTYLSHCMSYPKERRIGVVAHECAQPLEIWNDQDGFLR